MVIIIIIIIIIIIMYRWICIYPAYINSKKSIVEGRKVPKDKGADNPTVAEIRDVCTALGFNAVLEVRNLL